MRTLSYFFVLIFAAGVISCTGDDETIIETVVERQVQCHDGELVDDIADCSPRPVTPGPGSGQAPAPDDDRTSGECNLNATGKATFDGSSGDDVICGDGDNNTINALGGEDVVRAGGGNDIVDGGEGNDELYGEAGNDMLSGGEDEDIIDGGAGNDTLIGNEGRDEFKGGTGSDTVEYTGMDMDGDDTTDPLDINLSDGYSSDEYGDQDEYDGVENVTIKGDGENTITGDSNGNVLIGGTGADTIRGLGGNDRIDGGGGTDIELNGGDGTDTLVVAASTDLGDDNSEFENLEARSGIAATVALILNGDDGRNVIRGGPGDDTINGGAEDDMLYGGAGNDTLNGQAGRDTLVGEEGNDCFLLDAAAPVTVDTIRGFKDDRIAVNNVPSGELPIAESSRVVTCVDAVNNADTTISTPDDKCDAGSSKTVVANVSGLQAGTSIATDTCPSPQQ